MLVGCRRRGAPVCASTSTTPASAFPPAKRRAVFKEFQRLDAGRRGGARGSASASRSSSASRACSASSAAPGIAGRTRLAFLRRAPVAPAVPQRAPAAADAAGSPLVGHDGAVRSTTTRNILDGMRRCSAAGAATCSPPASSPRPSLVARRSAPRRGSSSTIISTRRRRRRRVGAAPEVRPAMPAALITADRSDEMRARAMPRTSPCSTSRSSRRRCAPCLANGRRRESGGLGQSRLGPNGPPRPQPNKATTGSFARQ